MHIPPPLFGKPVRPEAEDQNRPRNPSHPRNRLPDLATIASALIKKQAQDFHRDPRIAIRVRIKTIAPSGRGPINRVARARHPPDFHPSVVRRLVDQSKPTFSRAATTPRRFGFAGRERGEGVEGNRGARLIICG